MAALPYIQLYVADYLADTMHLTTEEHGAYMLLIMNYWQTGKPIPVNRLASVARMSNDRWNSVKDTLSEFFVLDQNNRWFHDRIEQELSKVLSKQTQASKAGKASAAKRAAKKASESINNSNGRSSDVSEMLQPKSNHTDTDTDTNNKKTRSKSTFDQTLFDRFWNVYPKKVKKKEVIKKFKSRNLCLVVDQLILDVENRIKNDRRWVQGFIPDPTTYINGDRWDDEVTKAVNDQGVELEWYDTASGIIEKGKELNLFEKDFDSFPYFKTAVMNAYNNGEQV